MTSGIETLLSLLDLEQADDNLFIGPASNEPHVRAFGGQVAAQALVAAGRTVTADRRPNSLHSYFIRPGSPSEPISYRTDVVRDGRSFSVRRVDAVQRNKVIFQLNASFHIAEAGMEHAEEPPAVAAPETLKPFDERFAGRGDTDMRRWFVRARPFDIRYVNVSPFDYSEAGSPAQQQVWVRAGEQLADDPLLHCAVFTYISDMTVLDAILLRHGIRWTDEAVLGASLDHALWFHQPFRVDDWLLLDQESPVAASGRGLARGKVWTQENRLVITIAQEALLRPPHV